MAKRHNPRPPGRRRPPSMAPVANEAPAASEATAVLPVDPPEPGAALPGPQETATSVQALLSADTASDVPTQAPVIEASLPGPEPIPSSAEPADAGPTLATQDVDVVASPALAALQAPPAFEDVPLVFAAAPHKAPSLVPTDLAAAGATLQAFFLNEGLAALAHWWSLAQARSPAEAIHLQVDEMQRAADASLTCMGRIAGHLGRIGAA